MLLRNILQINILNMIDVSKIAAYFEAIELPKELHLSKSERIFYLPKFVNNHIEVIQRYKHNESVSLPYYHRLQRVAIELKNNSKIITQKHTSN